MGDSWPSGVDGPACVGTIATHDAWHGFFGWSAVVLALLAALCALASMPGSRRRAVMAYATLALDALATVCLLVALAVVPDVVGSTGDLTQALGGGVHYSDLVANHHAWGFWVSLALAVVGLAAAALRVLAVRTRGMR
jgi:hypothetical protein